MWKGYCREAWDRTAALRHTMMQCGFSKFKQMPKMEDLNPVRAAEWEEAQDDFDGFSADIERMIRASR